MEREPTTGYKDPDDDNAGKSKTFDFRTRQNLVKDGYPDTEELEKGTDPLDPHDRPDIDFKYLVLFEIIVVTTGISWYRHGTKRNN